MTVNVFYEVMQSRRNTASLLGGILFALVLGLALTPKPASAACPIDDPTCGGGGGTIMHTLTVTNNQPGQGKVTSSPSGINCGLGYTDCTQSYSEGTTVTLNSSPAAGWALSGWGGDCSGSGGCALAMDADKSVSASWMDVQDPTVTLMSPANNAKVGPYVQAFATAADNSSVSQVQFLVDGWVRDTDRAPYAATLNMSSYTTLNMSSYTQGTHTIAARAVDGSGRWSQLSQATVTLDKTVSITAGSVPGVTNASSVPLTFSTDNDVPAASIECRVNSDPFAVCSSPFDPSLPNDGSYTYQVQVTDDVGNTATASRTFTVDRTAPSAPIIAAPANNSRLTTASFTVSGTAEANSHVELFDGTASRATTTTDSSGNWSLALGSVANGSHSYTAKATDAAGNTSGASNTRTVTVDTIKPTVKSVSPANLATRIGPANNVAAVFSEKMNATTINGKTFKLYIRGSTTPVAATVTYDGALRKATLDPDAGLRRGATYKAVITTGVKDLAGNSMAASKVWSFTVKK